MLGRQEVELADLIHPRKTSGTTHGVLGATLMAILAVGVGLMNLFDDRHMEVRAAEPVSSPSANGSRDVAAAADQQQPDNAGPMQPFSLAYIPRDAKLVAAVRGSALRKSAALRSLNEFLAKDQKIEKIIGISPDQIDQISGVYFEEGEGSIALIFHLTREEDVAAMAKALQLDPDEQTYAGRKYLRRTAQSSKPMCVFVDVTTVVVAQDEQHLRRLIIAGRDGASRAKWADVFNLSAGADAMALVNIQKLRIQQSLEGPFSLAFLFLGLPGELAPLLEASTVVLTISATEEIRGNVQLKGKDSNELDQLRNATKAVIDLSQAALSALRIEASAEPDEKGALELQFYDLADGLLDNVKVQTNETAVEASLTITRNEVDKIVHKLLSLTGSE